MIGDIGCGDCEHYPCACQRADDDDLWLACLADHDNIPVEAVTI